ncbi:MAG TPA: hypothetical protein VML57_09970 [Burkholderiales bacterium]|nr:hypothetical protein [Burkholderiales bacterium]
MLTLVVALVVLVALYRLAEGAIAGLILGVLDPLEHQGFQRKQVSAKHLFALAAVTLVLSVSYWLLRERDDRMARGS